MSSSEHTQSSQDTDSEIEDNGSEHGTGSKDANNRERDETESEDIDSSESDQSNSSFTDGEASTPTRPLVGLYNEAEIYDQFMNFVHKGCSTSGATVYVVSPFIAKNTTAQLLAHTIWGHLCQEGLTAKFKNLSTKGCGSHSDQSFKDFRQKFQDLLNAGSESQLDEFLKPCKNSDPQIKLYTRAKQIENLALLHLLRNFWDIYLQPTSNYYFHCKWAAVTNGKKTEVLLTSANLTGKHMKNTRTPGYHQTDSLSYLTISTGEFEQNFLGKLDFCTKEDPSGHTLFEDCSSQPN